MIKIIKIKRTIIIIILIPCLSGCMSIMSRISPDPFCSDIPKGTYRTFRCNLNQWKHIPENSSKLGNPVASTLSATFLILMGMIETPVALILDTFYLPYDISQGKKEKANSIEINNKGNCENNEECEN